MATVIVTLKIMPVSPDVNLDDLQGLVVQKITDFSGETEFKAEVEPIAFGLSALRVIFVMDESNGSTESLEDSISGLDGVQSVEVADIRRAVG